MSEASPKMPRRRLGRSGIEASVVGAGCWAIGGPAENLGLPMGWSGVDEIEARAGLDAAYASGVSLFDTADVYGLGRSERLVGQLVKSVPRASVVLTSKVGYFQGTARHAYEPLHMRHQLEQTLTNLQTDYLDLYFFHNANFGTADQYLDGAIETMRGFHRDGLIRSIGIRGPHRYALDRVRGVAGDKVARFEMLFGRIEPDVLAVRDNLLTPAARSAGIGKFADAHACGVIVNKPLAQGLLSGSYLDPGQRTFGAGDHRQRKAWFQPAQLKVINDGLRRLQHAIGTTDRSELLRLAIWSCLEDYPSGVVLCGFRDAKQSTQNAEAAKQCPDSSRVTLAREIMSTVQAHLDERTEVFLGEGSS